jgi:peptidoglycan-associated lipoprotein
MKKRIFAKVLLVTVCVLAGVAAWGQKNAKAADTNTGKLEIAIVFNPLMTNVVGGGRFWMQGGSVQVHGQFWRGVGVVGDVAGLHSGSVNGASVGLDLVTATFGPRYTWSSPHRRYAIFGQALGGTANGMNSLFPTAEGAESSANGYAMNLGGGANIVLTPQISLRAIEADWMRTDFPNSTSLVQNSLRLGAGFVYKFR